MKGMVFTEFLELVEEKFSPDLAEDILDACNLDSDGVYTAVGSYDHGELIQLVVQLSEKSGVAAPDLVRTFGHHLFGRFADTHPQFFEGRSNAFDFLRQVHDYIHVEVRKLYPDAELPNFSYGGSGDELEMTYSSTRPFADLAEGLINGCLDHFGESVSVVREDLSSDGTSARFVLTR